MVAFLYVIKFGKWILKKYWNSIIYKI